MEADDARSCAALPLNRHGQHRYVERKARIRALDRGERLVGTLAVRVASDRCRPLHVHRGELRGERARRRALDKPRLAAARIRYDDRRILRREIIEPDAPVHDILILRAEDQHVSIPGQLARCRESVLHRPHISARTEPCVPLTKLGSESPRRCSAPCRSDAVTPALPRRPHARTRKPRAPAPRAPVPQRLPCWLRAYFFILSVIPDCHVRIIVIVFAINAMTAMH